MHNFSLDLNLGQHSNYNNNNNNYNINNNNNSNLSTSSSYSHDNECIFNCSNTKDLLITNNNNNNTKTGRQMMAAQETKTADEIVESVRSANAANSGSKLEAVRPYGERDDVMYNAEDELKQTAAGLSAAGGILVDEEASYETDESGTAETERMQLNPSDNDGWEDDYDDDGDEDEDEIDEEEEEENEDEDDFAVEAPTVSAEEQARVAAFEALPEAKELVQSLVGDENESVKGLPDVLKAKSVTHTVAAGSVNAKEGEEEEEDMGFDEDDERIAIIVEKQRGNVNDNDKDFMNEEGSGAGGSGAYRRTEANRYKNNRFRLDYLEKYRRKQLKLQAEHTNRGVADSREGSGNFANDDDDDDDDDSDDRDDDDDDGDDDVDDGEAISGGANDDANRQEGDGYFNSKHTKSSSNRYFRKNTNDAIKIISTPLGKVGIVYQQTPTNEDGHNNANNNNKKQDAHGDKKTSSFTDFDALSPDPESSHRLASSHPKITPVLTPDGKVALLYRGDSENSKYEPIRNLTHKFNNNNSNINKHDFTDNKATSSGTITKETPNFPNNDGSEDESADESEDDYDLDSDNNSSSDRLQTNTRKTNNANPTDETQKAAIQNPDTDAEAPAAGGGGGGSFIIRPTDSVLPMINRPLSEVLGIKKNQFKQFRIKDQPTTPPNGESIDGDPRSLAGTSIDRTIDTTTLHFLTKVNLAEYPTSMKTRNFDFDFSRDNTMLDERSRHKEHQYQNLDQQQVAGSADNPASGGMVGEAGSSNNKLNTIANEEVLAKTEVVNLAIIPHFDEELERLQRLHEHEGRRHYRQRYRQKPSEEDLSGIHCIMQAMMGIAAISTVFGMLGTFFKQRILDQIRLMHW